MSKDTSSSERVRASFQQLSTAATQLNAVSDALGKSVTQLDEALKTLNLGVSAWVTIRLDHDPSGQDYSYEELGYDKVGNKWGITIRTRDGDHTAPEEETVERWLFSEAPRRLRIAAVEKVPELLEALTEQAGETTEKIKNSTAYVRDLAAAISVSTEKPKGKQLGGRQ